MSLHPSSALTLNLIKSNFAAATGAVNVATFLFGLMNPQLWSISTAILFVLGTAFVTRGSSFLPKAFPPGTEVIIVTVVATVFSMYFDYSGDVVGEIPAIDPDAGMTLLGGRLKIPVEVLDVKELITDVPITERFGNSWVMVGVSATLFAGVNFLSIMGIASGFETEDNIPWSRSSRIDCARRVMCSGWRCWVGTRVGIAVSITGFKDDWNDIPNGLHGDCCCLDLLVTLHEHHVANSQGGFKCCHCQCSGQRCLYTQRLDEARRA
jgi:hypothetical protein